MKKLLNGTLVDLTSSEVAAREDETQQWLAGADDRAAEENRRKRNFLLADCDWRFMSDQTPSQAWKDYRTSLRDITTLANWPNLEDSDWPTQP